MNIVIIGSGNVATHLAGALSIKHTIVSVYSRQLKNARMLADKVNSSATDDIKALPTGADIYIISVKDDAVSNIAGDLHTTGIVLHTAGSVPIGVLQGFKEHGVLYPFQTFSKNREVNFDNIPVLIEGNSDKAVKKITELAKSITNNIYNVNTEQRLLLHISAVFSCNFVNHFYHIADYILKKAGLPFDLLLPLIDETAGKVHNTSPRDAQTGPASRADHQILQKHIDILTGLDENKLASIYRDISESIIEMYNINTQKK